MGMVESAGPKKKGVGARKKSRVGLRIDMTPMVDIAFLLVIFFMTTTRFREPQAIEISLPKPGKPKRTKQSNVLVLKIGPQGEINYKVGESDSGAIALDSLDWLLTTRELENILRRDDGRVWADSLVRLTALVKAYPGNREYEPPFRMIKENISKLTVLIQVDPRSRYKSVIEVMDAVNYARMARFSVIRAGVLEKEAQQAPPAPAGAPPPPAAPPEPTGLNRSPDEYLRIRSA